MPIENEQPSQLLAGGVGPENKTETFSFTVVLKEYNGYAQIVWSQNCPARLHQSWVGLYKDGFPADPNNGYIYASWADHSSGSVDTGHIWGSGYCAALVAQDGYKNWVYVVKTPLTKPA